MCKKDFSELQINQKEERIRKIHKEIETLQMTARNETQMEQLLSLIDELGQLENIPEFDVKEGWKKFKRDYMPDIEKFKENEYYIKQQKMQYKRFAVKKVMSIVCVVIFTVVLASAVIGRTGFVNYFSRNAQGTEVISNKNNEEIQEDLEKEYVTLEKEYGVKIAKLNLPAEQYVLQSYELTKKFISIEYLNMNEEKNINFCFLKTKPSYGEFNLEKTDVIEVYTYNNIMYNIIENKERYNISWEKEGIYYILQNCSSIEECKKIIENITY